MSERTESRHPARTLPVGRVLRLLLGAALVAQVSPFFLRAGADSILGAVSLILGITLLYVLLHWIVSRFLTRLNPWLGAMLAVLPVFLVFVMGGALGEVAAIAFIGVSLLLASIRADSGCEVMSIPGIVFGRRTHLVCLLFSPLDWIEEKIVSAFRTPKTGTTS